MFADGEVVAALLGVGVLVFALASGRKLSRVPSPWLLLGALAVLLVGWIATAVEELVWPDVLNLVEHTCYLVAALAVAAWCVRASSAGGRAR